MKVEGSRVKVEGSKLKVQSLIKEIFPLKGARGMFSRSESFILSANGSKLKDFIVLQSEAKKLEECSKLVLYDVRNSEHDTGRFLLCRNDKYEA